MGKQYPLKAVRTHAKAEKKTFGQNLLEAIRLFLEPIQFFVLGAMSIPWEAPEKGAYQLEERL